MVTLSSSNHQQLPRQDLTQHHIRAWAAMKTWNDLQFYLCLSSAAHHASVVAGICESCPGNVQPALGSACKQISSHAETKLWQIQIRWNKSMTNTNILKQKYDKYKIMKNTSGNINDMLKWCSMWKLFKGQCFCVSTRWCTRCCNKCTRRSRKRYKMLHQMYQMM